MNNTEKGIPNKSDIVVGLDIGTTKIACFVGHRTENGKIRILGYAKEPSVGVLNGVVYNVVDAAKQIKRVVSEASERSNYEIEEVYVGIAGQHIKGQSRTGSISISSEQDNIIEEKDVDKLIEDQNNIVLGPGEEIIHIFPKTWIVDDKELPENMSPKGVRGKQLKGTFHIVTCNMMHLRNLRDSVQLAGMKIKGVVLEPIASALAVLDQTDKEDGVALVDIGGGTTDIAVFHEGIIRHTAVLPIAGNYITGYIKEKCNLRQEVAESLKTRFGSCLPDQVRELDFITIPGVHQQQSREINVRLLAEIIKDHTDTLLDQVYYEIQKSKVEHKLDSIVITGGGAQLKHLKELTEFKTTIYTRVGYPNEHLEADTEKEIKDSMYATGIGLVMYGIEELEDLRRRERENKENSTTEERRREESEEEEQPKKKVHSDAFSAFGELDNLEVEKEEKREEKREENVKPEVNYQSETKKKKNKKSERGFIKDWMSRAQDVINTMFTDSNSDIRNEGDNDID